MLRFPEELMLFLLKNEKGEFVHVRDLSLECALAGAVLMDLALEHRIDTDLHQLVVIDPTPLQDDLLDPTLARIVKTTETRDTRYWIEQTSEHAHEIRKRALARLVERGILRREEDRSFRGLFRKQRDRRRYPIIDGRAAWEVKLRITGVLFSDEIPDPRDIVIICLTDACGILKELLSARELKRATARIEQVRKMELIGREVSQTIWEIDSYLALTMQEMITMDT